MNCSINGCIFVQLNRYPYIKCSFESLIWFAARFLASLNIIFDSLPKCFFKLFNRSAFKCNEVINSENLSMKNFIFRTETNRCMIIFELQCFIHVYNLLKLKIGSNPLIHTASQRFQDVAYEITPGGRLHL